MADWQLRAAMVEDIDNVLDLWRRAEATVSSTDNAEALRVLIEGWPGALILADQDGALVGSIIASFDGWRGLLARLVVAPEVRRLGLGQVLVSAGEERLRRVGVRRVSALVESDQPLSMSFWMGSDYTLHPSMRRFYRDV